MSWMKSLAAAPALALFLAGTSHAALTADQVWQAWKDNGAAMGLDVTAATESNANGVLTLNGVSVAFQGQPVVTLSDMVMTEQSDGSVTVAPGAEIDVMIPNMPFGTVQAAHDGLTMTVREDQEAMLYSYSAAKLDLGYDIQMEDESGTGSAVPMASYSGTVSFENLSGTYANTPGANRTLGLDLIADRVLSSSSSFDPVMSMKQSSTGDGTGVKFSLALTLPSSISLFDITTASDFGTALTEGLMLQMSSTYDQSSNTMTQESPYLPLDVVINAVNAAGSLSLDKDKFDVKSTLASLEVETAPDSMGIPFKLTSGPMEFYFLTPVMAPTAPADFAVLIKLNQLTLNNEAWAMFDPTASLKRDAADLVIDLTGKVQMDLIALMAAEESDTIPPTPLLDSVNINEISAKVAGAALLATGAFTFDNTTETPMPLGEANVTITGANQLIDGLVANGLLAEEDVMGMRTMMGMFMVPGTNPDELTSKIEAKEGFEILVNGQPLPM